MARITQLEDALYNDSVGKTRQQALDQLASAMQKLEQHMRKPNNVDTHQALIIQRDAYAAATHIVDILWQRYHSRHRHR